MPKYNQSEVAGEFWRRSPQVYCYNAFNETPGIAYDEEDIILLSNGEFAAKRLSTRLIQEFSPENANTEFQLKNPETEEYIGKTATYKDLYVLMYSLYFHLATERDKGPKPYSSWTWNDTTNQWESPVPKPEGDHWGWDENAQSWFDLTPQPPQPYPSWTWNGETNEWSAPVPKPNDGLEYIWNEETQSWEMYNGY